MYGAVKQAGGSIEMYREVGIGTTFKIYLPRVEGDAVKLVKDDRSAVLPEGAETVLVVEDEDIVRNLGVLILEGLGYKVMQAGNGDEATFLAAGYRERIDLLLTDVVMPGMNGRELATQLVAAPPGDEGSVHIGVHGRRDHTPRGSGQGGIVHREALYPLGIGEEGAGST